MSLSKKQCEFVRDRFLAYRRRPGMVSFASTSVELHHFLSGMMHSYVNLVSDDRVEGQDLMGAFDSFMKEKLRPPAGAYWLYDNGKPRLDVVEYFDLLEEFLSVQARQE